MKVKIPLAFIRGLYDGVRQERYFSLLAGVSVAALVLAISWYEYALLKRTALLNTRTVAYALFPVQNPAEVPPDDPHLCEHLVSFLGHAGRVRPDVSRLFVVMALPGQEHWVRLEGSPSDCLGVQTHAENVLIPEAIQPFLARRTEGVSRFMRDDSGRWVVSLVSPFYVRSDGIPTTFLVVQQEAARWLTRYATSLFPWVLVFAFVVAMLFRIAKKQRKVNELVTLRQTLEEANLFLTQAHEIGHLGSWKFSPKANVLDWSDACYVISGQSRALHPVQTIGDFWARVHPEDREEVEQAFLDTLRTHSPGSVKHRIVGESADDVRSVLQRFRWIFDAEGTPSHLIGIMLDLTELHARESALRAQEGLLRDVLNTTRDGYWVVNAEGRLEDVNESYCKMTGYSREEMLTLYIRDLDAVESEEVTQRRMEEIRANGFVRFQTVHRRKDGTLMDVEVSVTFSEVSGGKMVCFCSDITARKEAQRKQIELNAQLEKSLQESRVLAHQALAAHRAKSAFMATMSHEIRTPLNGVIAMADLLANTTLNADQRDMVETVRQSGTLLLDLAARILDLARLDNHSVTHNYRPVHLSSLLGTCLAAIEGSARTKGLHTSLHIAPDVPEWVYTDGERVQQVILHVLDNALKFTEYGNVTVFVSSNVANEARALRFEVQDTGIGIAADVGDRIFSRFMQLDSSSTRKYGGAGLGLALAREVVTWMGGEMGYTSTVGQGSTFWFTLPCTATALT